MPCITARYAISPERSEWGPCRICFEQGQITSVEPAAAGAELDYDQAVALPAFVNAHTHLEFSSLEHPLGTAGMRFPEWIRRVVRWRQEESNDKSLPGALEAGGDESLQAGVAAVGEICTSEHGAALLAQAPLGGVAFRELLGLSRQREVELVSQADTFLRTFRQPGWQAGISPHAPYTVGPALLEQLVKRAHLSRAPVAMHLAESVDELELMQSHSGPLWELLRDLDAWDPSALPRGIRVADYVQLLSAAPRALIIHGNYLDSTALNMIATRREQMAIVYCPRTHAFFGHGRYPLHSLLEAGITVACGTDSRASNPDLNMLGELQFLAAQYPEVPPSRLLEMGTLAAAKALGQDDRYGSLQPGKRADLLVLDISQAAGSSAAERVLAGPTSVMAVYRGGERVV